MYYDENDNLIKEQVYYENKLRVTSDYLYNDKNNIIKISTILIGKSKTELIYNYDENDNLLTVEDSNVIQREYKYDKQGRLVKYSSFGYDYIYDYEGGIPWIE
mgnify:FL=1